MGGWGLGHVPEYLVRSTLRMSGTGVWDGSDGGPGSNVTTPDRDSVGRDPGLCEEKDLSFDVGGLSWMDEDDDGPFEVDDDDEEFVVPSVQEDEAHPTVLDQGVPPVDHLVLVFDLEEETIRENPGTRCHFVWGNSEK